MTTPRMIEWTGERCVPWADDVQMVYEHVHRYAFAARRAAGRTVVDLASGEGYGAALLAEVATDVVGIEIDPAAVEHARAVYQLPNLRFEQGDMLDLSDVAPGSVDLVTCFEALEHVAEHDQLIEQVDRILAADGMLVISTPDRTVYTETYGQHNPFHVRELDRDEFASLLRTRFPHIDLWSQRLTTGSMLEPLTDAPTAGLESTTIERVGDGFRLCDPSRAPYLVAIASRQRLPAPPQPSWLHDESLDLVNGMRRDLAGRRAEAQQLTERVMLLDAAVFDLAEDARNRIVERDLLVGALSRRAENAEADMAAMKASKGWRALVAYRRVHHRVRSFRDALLRLRA